LLEHSDSYILKCVSAGILTKEPLYKYPLRNANLAVVLKAYAVATNQPYTITKEYEYLDVHKLYLTKGGFEWLLGVFKQYSLTYLRSTFGHVFINADEKDVGDLEYLGYNNLRGLSGERPKAGTKQKAVLVHRRGRRKVEYKFNTLRAARDEIFNLSRFYPIDEFTLYRIRKNTKRGTVYYYREEVRTLLPTNNRGAVTNLPHVRK